MSSVEINILSLFLFIYLFLIMFLCFVFLPYLFLIDAKRVLAIPTHDGVCLFPWQMRAQVWLSA